MNLCHTIYWMLHKLMFTFQWCNAVTQSTLYSAMKCMFCIFIIAQLVFWNFFTTLFQIFFEISCTILRQRLGRWVSVLIFAGTIDHCDKMTYNCIISYQDFVYIFIFTCISNFIIVFYYNCTYLSALLTRKRPKNKFSPHPSKQDLDFLLAQPNQIKAIHDYSCKII